MVKGTNSSARKRYRPTGGKTGIPHLKQVFKDNSTLPQPTAFLAHIHGTKANPRAAEVGFQMHPGRVGRGPTEATSEVLTKKRSDRWESLKVQPIHLLPHNFIVDSVRSFLTSKMWVRSFIRTGQGHWYCRTFPCNEFSRLQFVVRESASFSRLR